MGSSNSVEENYTGPNLTEDMMDDYLQLTYLSRKEIFRIHKRMQHICGDEFNALQRIVWDRVLDAFPELKANPFVDRLSVVFSSQRDGKVSFEDMLDLFSALSPDCPAECKAKWAFKIFDFNNSNALEAEDLSELIDRLTSGKKYKEGGKCLTQEEKDHITDIILHEIDLDYTGSIVTIEFVHAIVYSKMPDFSSSFTLKL